MRVQAAVSITLAALGIFSAASAALFSVTSTVLARSSIEDGTTCLVTAERVDEGEALSDAEKEEAHQACLRAMSATGSVLQKQQFDQADFAIMGKRHKY